ncbi:MAG: dehydratase, partial [bacterium]|nr:dehydratase [bacterium]MCP4401471.1 dehydratase [bacterium]
DRGIIWEDVQLRNQRDEIVAEGEHVVMMQRKP